MTAKRRTLAAGVRTEAAGAGRISGVGSESFNARVRAECLNVHRFESLGEASETIEAWRIDYNESRTHSALGNLSPREFAASNTRECTAG
ncbi:MAG: transposase [Phycisphaeraceae bacterium]|nr:transposase [Phycisphaeraceae bacterium]